MNVNEFLGNIFEINLIKDIEAHGKLMECSVGESLIKNGQTIRHIPIIIEGAVKVSRVDEEGQELLLYYVNPMESCAMTFNCCMSRQQSEISVIAETDVKVLLIPIAFMDEWMIKYHTWRSFVMRTIKFRFDEMLHTIDQVAFQKLDERLIFYLKEKSKTTHSTLINLSHQQIADELATSRVVISRLLKKLENEQKILLYRNQIKLLKTFDVLTKR